MVKPYFERIRIGRDEDTREEHEYPLMCLWCEVVRIEEATGDDFKNQAPKCIVFLSSGSSPWLLTPYAEMCAAWKRWLDAADNIQSVFRNN